MIPVIISVLGTVGNLIETHPDLAKALLNEAATLLGFHEGNDDRQPHPEAVRAMVAGLAASRADIVQRALRRAKHDAG